MRTNKERLAGLLLTLIVTFLTIAGIVWADGPSSRHTQKQRFKWIVTKRLTVQNAAIFNGLVTINDELHVDNSQDSVALNVQGYSTQNYDLLNAEQSDGTDKFSVSNEGQTRIVGERDAVTGRDNFLFIEGNLEGMQNNANTRGQLIEVERPTTAIVTGTNITDYGLMIRAKTKATVTTSGPTLYGADIEAKTDDNAQWSVLRGVQATAVTDPGGWTDTQVALRAHAEVANTAWITTTLQVADFELNRKDSDAPTNEWGVNIRNTSAAGTGADVALRIESSFGAGGSATTDVWDYGIDMSPANIGTADIRLSQGETIDNLTDGEVKVTGHVSVTGNISVAGTSDLIGNVFDSQGDLTIDDNLAVTGTSDLQGAVSDSTSDLMLNDSVNVSGDLDVDGGLIVTGTTLLRSTLDVRGAVSDGDTDLMLNDNVNVSGNLDVDGAVVITGTLSDSDTDLMVNDNLNVSGNTDVVGTLEVTGTTTLRSTLDVRGAVSDGDSDLMLNDSVNVSGDLDVDTNVIVTGTTTLRSTLDAQGAVSDSTSDLMLNDNVNVSGNLDVTGATVVTGTISDADTDLMLDDTVNVSGDFHVDGDIYITGTQVMMGIIDAQNYIHNSTGDLDLRDNVTVTGDVDITGNLAVTGTSDLRGNVSDEAGTFTIADNVLVDGQADNVQLIVQGNATGQASGLFAAEDSAGTDMFSIGPTGNTFISGTLDVRGTVSDGDSDLDITDNVTVTGNVDITGNLAVTGTSDLRGNVSDGVGTFTLADDGIVDGQADAIQWTVQGNAGGQTSNLLVCEDSGGTDVFYVGPTGNTWISGTLDVDGASTLGSTADIYGAISNSTGDLDLRDNVTVTGDVDVTGGLVVTGTTLLRSTLDVRGAVSDGDSDLDLRDNVTITGNIDVTGSGTISGSLTVDDVFNLDDSIYTFSGAQSHTPVESMFIGNPGGDLILTLQTGSAAEGDFLYIVNIHASNCITVVDTGATAGGGDRRLNENDVIGFIYAGAAWVESFFSDNS